MNEYMRKLAELQQNANYSEAQMQNTLGSMDYGYGYLNAAGLCRAERAELDLRGPMTDEVVEALRSRTRERQRQELQRMKEAGLYIPSVGRKEGAA